ncbi:AfsR/SARP family transcriptional regulator [Amycolatopsis nalaikhensis]|uniref:BTAD domain-containing putative transcriptional regulator n=1 Tax=Amycolatopsis nalaikhensis TaxID=715472 RepID=A0ABY8XUG0_9PSEU|nr:BTAD domain-containing putative transcriptional regulator [Amycolatopsis sp. 2-2]WIV59223.1 BTAD domain-containing putative transcriptional regulator [Amycolatopsis sp. 2-2]
MKPEVLVLGTVGVRCGGHVHHPSSGLSRALLALLAEAGSAGVTAERLGDTVWGELVSASALTVAMHRLRRWLRGVAGTGLQVERTPVGYALRPGAATDVARFRATVAGAALLEPREKAATLGDAVALWRGTPLVDVPAERADPALLAQLVRELRDATVARGTALLEAGEPAAAAEALEPGARQHLLDEPLHAAWIVALAGAGRQAEAIAAFQAIRGRLREECGVDPGRELTAALTRARRTPPSPRPAAPAQLPFDAAGFTGRQRELTALTAAARTHRAVVVTGMGGVGKTALAVHWAHHGASRFPDGQLYADLRGYAAEAPMRPVDVLRGFLVALGVPRDRLPTDLDEAAAQYRSFLGGRRVLVVLDNAADADQARPLLPGGPGCLVLVTGRDGLDGLVAVDGAARLGLDVLDEASAAALLRWSIGDARADREPDAVRALARACGFLPLALRVAALRLTVSGTLSVAAYTARLWRNGRLAELAVVGDPRADLGAVFDHSYRRLPEPARRLFRLLGQETGPDITVERTAALVGLDPVAAQREIDRLMSAHLLVSPAAGRYALHELVREHARSGRHIDAAARA